MTALTLYGANIAAASPSTAGKMFNVTGGVEGSAVTTGITNNLQYFEVMAFTGNSVTIAAIPATPRGNGWAYVPGAGTFAADNWSATVTIAHTGSGSQMTIRFFQYTGTYTLIGSIAVTLTTMSKHTYSFAATAMGAVTFGTTDVLYTDLWYYDNSSNAKGDTVTLYEANSSSTGGVASDIQIVTGSFTPSGGGGPLPSATLALMGVA
jgi:hypothetical protein